MQRADCVLSRSPRSASGRCATTSPQSPARSSTGRYGIGFLPRGAHLHLPAPLLLARSHVLPLPLRHLPSYTDESSFCIPLSIPNSFHGVGIGMLGLFVVIAYDRQSPQAVTTTPE